MRTIIKIAGFFGIAVLVGLISCIQDNETEKLSDAAKQYLSMRVGTNSAMSRDMTGAINRSFGGLYNSFALPNGKVGGDSTELPSDSTIIEDPWKSCAIITDQLNDDGSRTYTYDYGDGCEEGYGDYKYFMHGKMSYTYLNQYTQVGSVYHDTYYYSSNYDNYGGNYAGQWQWLLNGGGTSQGESQYDTATQQFSGSYSYSDETTYQYDTVTYFYKGHGNTMYDQNKYVVKSSEYEYSDGADSYYKVKVLKPLMMDYSCYSNQTLRASFCWFFTYVSGRERIQYKNELGEGSFEIDYGDGECDNIIMVYENGKVSIVDLSKLWGDGPVQNKVQ